jgi:transposase
MIFKGVKIMSTRRQYTGNQKFKVALDACRGNLTIAELSKKHGVAPSLIQKWKSQLIESGGELFDRGHKPSDERIVFENEQLLKKVGQLTLEVDFLKKACASV